jgi:hypothetical protein
MINLQSDPAAAKMHPNGEWPDESLVVNAKGHLANAVVYIDSGLEQLPFERPSQPITFTTDRCRYRPRAFAIMVGQELIWRNRDDIEHNPHIPSIPNKERMMERIKPLKRFRFATVGEPERIRCDAHPWEIAWVVVLSHPFSAVSNDDGEFEIHGLSPGRYTVTVWHEACTPVRKVVHVAPKRTEYLSVALALR